MPMPAIQSVPALFFVSALVATATFVPTEAMGAECRITTIDGFLGMSSAGVPGGLGLKSRVDPYLSDGLLATLSRRGISGVTVRYEALLPGQNSPLFLGTAISDDDGIAQLPIADFYGIGSAWVALFGEQGGEAVEIPLIDSQYIQIIASTEDAPSDCDGGMVWPDVYGSLYFRSPGDDAPILFTDIDDTLFDSADVSDIFRAITVQHFSPIDNAAVPSTHTLRNEGVVIIGVTAQFNNLRPFTRSEMMFWSFEESYFREPHFYQGTGFDGSYLPRTLSFIANDDYSGTDPSYSRDHCAFKVERIHELVGDVFAGDWGAIAGLIGDSPDSDGCAAEEIGLHWYFLREPGDNREPDTAGAYTEIVNGWQEALPVLCDDMALDCDGLPQPDPTPAPEPEGRMSRK